MFREVAKEYAFYFNTTFGTYRFIIADTVQDPGLINFFNLFGESKEDKLNELESIINENSPDFNQTLFVGHHPIQAVYSELLQNYATSGTSC